MQLTPYLLFNGNCREAMTFYQSCIGGKLQLQTLKDVPSTFPFLYNMQDFILQACLQRDSFRLCGSDLPIDEKHQQGNTMSLLLVCGHYQELHDIYLSLSDGAELLHTLHQNAHQDWLANLKDKYGHYWTLACHANR